MVGEQGEAGGGGGERGRRRAGSGAGRGRAGGARGRVTIRAHLGPGVQVEGLEAQVPADPQHHLQLEWWLAR